MFICVFRRMCFQSLPHRPAIWVLMILLGRLWWGELPARAQARYWLDVWTTDNGLPQNIIRGIHQGPDGYLWLATLDGLARLDGVRFTIFDKSNSAGISSNRFTSIFEDRDGVLWAATEAGGITRYQTGRFTTLTTEQGLGTNWVGAVFGDENGRPSILVQGRLLQWNGARFEQVIAESVPFVLSDGAGDSSG